MRDHFTTPPATGMVLDTDPVERQVVRTHNGGCLQRGERTPEEKKVLLNLVFQIVAI